VDGTPLGIDQSIATRSLGPMPAYPGPSGAVVQIDAEATRSSPGPVAVPVTDAPPAVDLTNDPELVSGTNVGEYRILERIGAGGMGSVYLGIHPRIEKKVAVKVLSRQMSGDLSIVQRFVTEARAVNRIGHPNIVDIFADGQLPDGRPYLVMEFLNGKSLRQRMKEGPAPTYREALEIIRAISSALAAAHEEKIVHRDLKPDNIFLAEVRGTRMVKLLDFGIAKVLAGGPDESRTQTGISIGTPTYMAPEQCLNREVDGRTDIYALGVIMFALFTGRRPFHGESSFEVFQGHVSKKPPLPSTLAPVPAAIEALILHCLEKDPKQRPQTATELMNQIDKILSNLGQELSVPLSWSAAGAGMLTPSTGLTTGLSGEVSPAYVRQRKRGAARVVFAVAGVAAAVGAWFVFARTRVHEEPPVEEPKPTIAATTAPKSPQPEAPAPSVPPATGGVTIATDSPVDLTWKVDGVATPMRSKTFEKQLAPGKHTIQASAPGYLTVGDDIIVVAGETAKPPVWKVEIDKPSAAPQPTAPRPAMGKRLIARPVGKPKASNPSTSKGGDSDFDVGSALK
jgi:serine/threonine-protein kinase